MKKVESRRQNENVLRRVRHFFHLLPSAFCLLVVRLYQLTLSPAKNVLLGPAGHCRFEPSCSQYAVEALKTHGALSGTWLAAKRVCRCHPWGDFGEDPVPATKSRVHSPQSEVYQPSVGFGVTESPESKATMVARLNAARTAQRAVPTEVGSL